MHLWGGFSDQVIGTAILLFPVLAVTDPRNSSPLSNPAPVVVGLIVVAIGMAWGAAAPLIGGLIGAGLYKMLIGRFLPGETAPEAVAQEQDKREHQPA